MTESIETTEADALPWQPPAAPAITAMEPLPVTAATIEGARKILARLCNSGQVRMTVPPREDDEDMILLAIIELAALTVSNEASEPAATDEPETDERAAFIAWLGRSYPHAYDEDDAAHLWSHSHVTALAWQARAARANKQEAIEAALSDSQFLAGMAAGWNSAQAEDPNAAFQKLRDAYAGYLKPIKDTRAAPQSTQGAPATCRLEDGRCGICGGNWSVCGCDGMLRRAARPATEARKP